ncbi:MAG: hypothetical protein N3A57_00740 [Negativicutes bacterium]|nr:hypothetical protein [Negativicutes bacterium]
MTENAPLPAERFVQPTGLGSRAGAMTGNGKAGRSRRQGRILAAGVE